MSEREEYGLAARLNEMRSCVHLYSIDEQTKAEILPKLRAVKRCIEGLRKRQFEAWLRNQPDGAIGNECNLRDNVVYRFVSHAIQHKLGDCGVLLFRFGERFRFHVPGYNKLYLDATMPLWLQHFESGLRDHCLRKSMLEMLLSIMSCGNLDTETVSKVVNQVLDVLMHNIHFDLNYRGDVVASKADCLEVLSKM
jgi:hypothetical protein